MIVVSIVTWEPKNRDSISHYSVKGLPAIKTPVSPKQGTTILFLLIFSTPPSDFRLPWAIGRTLNSTEVVDLASKTGRPQVRFRFFWPSAWGQALAGIELASAAGRAAGFGCVCLAATGDRANRSQGLEQCRQALTSFLD